MKVKWFKTPCDTAACLEAGVLEYGDIVIRSSQFRARTVVVTPREWQAFVQAVKNGHFDGVIRNPK